METENIRPSPLQNKNLAILYAARAVYFPNKGLYPYLISTYFFYIDEQARRPLTEKLLPLVNDENNRRILDIAVKEQGHWEPLKPFESSWTFFRKLGMGSTKEQPFEDLLQLDYYRLFDGVAIPSGANLSLFWGGLVDFLVNSWSILEEFCLVIEVKNRIEEHNKIQNKELSKKETGPWRTVVSWEDMHLEHHLVNLIIRLRAGWDKLADYMIGPYYAVTPAKEWNKRVNKLDRELLPKLNATQRMFWSNWLTNAKEVSKEMWLKDVRDLELHKIALRVKETLGHPQRAPALSELENFVLFEHFRLQESFLLVLAMIRSA